MGYLNLWTPPNRSMDQGFRSLTWQAAVRQRAARKAMLKGREKAGEPKEMDSRETKELHQGKRDRMDRT